MLHTVVEKGQSWKPPQHKARFVPLLQSCIALTPVLKNELGLYHKLIKGSTYMSAQLFTQIMNSHKQVIFVKKILKLIN